jgi:hypothetical protein
MDERHLPLALVLGVEGNGKVDYQKGKGSAPEFPDGYQ